MARPTNVRVRLQYDPPGGKLGAWVAWVFGEEPSVADREGPAAVQADHGSVMVRSLRFRVPGSKVPGWVPGSGFRVGGGSGLDRASGTNLKAGTCLESGTRHPTWNPAPGTRNRR